MGGHSEEKLDTGYYLIALMIRIHSFGHESLGYAKFKTYNSFEGQMLSYNLTRKLVMITFESSSTH